MECILSIETQRNQTLLVSGSYHSRERIYENVIVTDADSYRLDILRNQLVTGSGVQEVAAEKENLSLVTRDFVAAVREGRPPAVPGRSVLPAMRILDAAQQRWDAIYGRQSLPGRRLAE